MDESIEELLNKILNETQGAAKEIYYAISLLPINHPAEANLVNALTHLGITHPKEVGLSSVALTTHRSENDRAKNYKRSSKE